MVEKKDTIVKGWGPSQGSRAAASSTAGTEGATRSCCRGKRARGRSGGSGAGAGRGRGSGWRAPLRLMGGERRWGTQGGRIGRNRMKGPAAVSD